MDKKTTTDESKTTTPNVPGWGAASLQDLNGRINALGAVDPSSYVAPASGLQTQAFDAASHLGGWQGDAGTASGILSGIGGASTTPMGAAPTVHAGSLLDNLDSYQSPYTHDVVDSTLANFDKTSGQQSAALAASGAKNGAFGGSRFGIAQGELGAQQNLNRAQTEATLRDQAFTTGAGLSSQDAARRQAADTTNAGNALTVSQDNQNAQAADLSRRMQAGGLLAGLSNDEASNARNDIATQDQMGQDQRSIDASQRTAPISLAQTIATLLQGNQLGLLTGSTDTGHSTQTVSDPMGAIGGILGGLGSAAQGAAAMGGPAGLAAMFSDARLKRDITTLGYDAKGRRRVSWRYLWDRADAEPHQGFIAQELLATDPYAVIVGPGGFLMVNYGAL